MHDADLTREALADLPPDIATSPLFNGDLAPVPKGRRNWSTYNFAALWVSMAHCIPTYMLAGGLIAVGMNWWQALLTIGLGNIIVLAPILLNAHPGTKYGVPFPVLARASFGTRGANVPAVLRAIVACGWFGIQTFIGGEAVKTFLEAVWPTFGTLGGDERLLGLSLPSALTFLVFWLLQILIIFRGMNAVRVFENWAAPLVLVMAAVLLYFVVSRAGGVGPLLEAPSKFSSFAEFWPHFIPALTGMIGFWSTLSLNIPDFTRFGKGQREQMVGQTLGLPTTMLGFSAMGVVITSASQVILKGTDASKLWDPVFVLAQLTSTLPPAGLDAPLIASPGTRAVVAVVALFGVAVATISVNIAANVVSPANDFANLAPRLISFKTGGLITGVVGIAMMPWKLLASADTYIFDWLGGYSALLGPIAGIMIADYYLIRNKTLNVPELYRERGEYSYGGGFNPNAIVALVAGVLPCLPGFVIQMQHTGAPKTFWEALFGYAWFVSFGVSFGVYAVFQRVFPRARAGRSAWLLMAGAAVLVVGVVLAFAGKGHAASLPLVLLGVGLKTAGTLQGLRGEKSDLSGR